MSKEELLKYLIAEIDLIMHDKDYRFENANGTWYSRESCRDLTNEEVFEELRTELRQFADLEAKLADMERCAENNKKVAELVSAEHNTKIEKLEQQLADKDAEIEKLNACVDFYKSYYISFKGKVIDELEKVKRYIDDKAYYVEEENFGIEINEYIDNQINQINELKGKK